MAGEVTLGQIVDRIAALAVDVAELGRFVKIVAADIGAMRRDMAVVKAIVVKVDGDYDALAERVRALESQP